MRWFVVLVRWLWSVIQPGAGLPRKAAIVVNLAPVLLPAAAIAAIASFRQWVQTDWHWIWLIGALFVGLLAVSSFRQYRALHPFLDIKINASRPIDHNYLDWMGSRYRIITLPYVQVDTRYSSPSQLEFRLVGKSWTLEQYPMSRIMQEEPMKFPSSMTNPKTFGKRPADEIERPAGEFTRNLNFAGSQDEIGIEPDLEGLRLEFRNVYVPDDPWKGFTVPGVFDSRLRNQAVVSKNVASAEPS